MVGYEHLHLSFPLPNVVDYQWLFRISSPQKFALVILYTQLCASVNIS